MRIGLFAARHVGYEVAKFLAEQKESLTCLVLDSNDTDSLNTRFIDTLGYPRVIYSDVLYTDQAMMALREMELDLIILAWWPYLVKKSLLELPRVGCLNFHPSYLPYNRGKNPNFWTLVDEVPFGVTLHWVDEGIDTGDIAFQAAIEKTWEDTGETMYIKAREGMVRLFKEALPYIKKGDIPRIKQTASRESFHKARELTDASMIDLEKTYRARDLLNILRARTFRPYPGAWFIENGVRYEIRIEITRVRDDEDKKQ